MRTPRTHCASLAAVSLFAAIAGAVSAQTVPASQDTAPKPGVQEETLVLSPFVVTADEDAGTYKATSTLAGARVRTELRDVASSISVITSEFLKNTGAKNNQDLLVYTANTEVGGIYGNYGGVGNTFINGISEEGTFLKPNNNTRVRGLDSADNTRDFFATDIPWDGYIVGRVDLQRGPNSILFGIGSPAGIINSSINTASYRTGGNIENRLGSFGSVRFSLDYNQVLIPNTLAVRVAALDDNTKYRQDPAFNHDKRVFVAGRWDPKLFGENSSAQTSLRVNFEHGEVKANRPRVLPPEDRITPWFDTGGINRTLYDPYYTWQAGIIGYQSSNALPPGARKNYWVVQYIGPGMSQTGPTAVYNGPGASDISSFRASGPSLYWGLKSDGTYDHQIDGFPYGSNIGIGSYSDFALNVFNAGLKDSSGNVLYPAADKGFWKNKSLIDPTVFDFYNHLIDGPNKREWQKWNAYNISASQTFLNNRLGFEVVYDYQDYNDGQTRNLNSPFIGVDIRQNLMDMPYQLGGAMANPNAGRAFIGANSKSGGNSANFTTRENIRGTVFGELRATDFLKEGWLTRLLGRVNATGLYSRETYTVESRNWIRYALDQSWSDTNGSGTREGGSNSGGLSNGDVTIDWMTYLSGNLSGTASASGLNLQPISAVQQPAGSYSIAYFDSHWAKPTNPSAPGYVDPAAAWLNVARGLTNDPVGEATTQSENPANYKGWTTGSFSVLNADEGDINRLYTDVSKVRKRTTSNGITLQAYLVDDLIVGTWGWRRDRQDLYSAASQSDLWTAAHTNLTLGDLDNSSVGTSISAGVVIHTPKRIRAKLPFNTDIGLTFSDGRNTRVENRYDFGGNPLPNAKGRTKDMGVVISTLDDRLQFKITHYKTTVSDANITSVTTEASTLGANTYYLRNLEAWGTASALLDLAGRDGGASGWEWYWNWALVDGGWDGKYNDPNGADFKNSPSTAAQTKAINSWLSQLMPQSWFDAYGFKVDVTKAKAGDWRNAIVGWTPFSGVGGLQPQGGGRVNGVWPTGTVDNESKGMEYEIVGTPIKGLNVSINASKTHASQTALGQSLVDFIEAQYLKYQSPAGDLRLWWGGDNTVRQYYVSNIWSAYQFQLKTNGKLVPEMAPWRANVVANYNFQGPTLRGVNVGLAYRWQDKRILGYALNSTKDNLDVDKPYWSSTEDNIDCWAGYERKINGRFNWRVQLNLRSVGKSTHLVKLSVQPDGTGGAYRIEEGMTWQLTNTISF